MTDIFLRAGASPSKDITLRDPTAADVGGSASDSTTPPTYAFTAAVPTEAISQATVAPTIVWTVATPAEKISQATVAPSIVWTVAAPGEAVSQGTAAPAETYGAITPAEKISQATAAPVETYSGAVPKEGVAEAAAPTVLTFTPAQPAEGIAASDASVPPVLLYVVADPTQDPPVVVQSLTSGGGFAQSPKAWERPPFAESTAPPAFRWYTVRPTEEIAFAPPATVPEIVPSVLGGRYVAAVPMIKTPNAPPAPAPVLRVLTFAEDVAPAAECRFELAVPEEGVTLQAAEVHVPPPVRPVRDVYRLSRNKDRLIARGDRLAWRKAA